MSRAVLTILVALPMLMPYGVCLRKFDRMGWLLRTPVSAAAPTQVTTQRSNDRHPSGCRCGCQQRVAQADEGGVQAGDPVDELRPHDDSPPLQPREPCCPTICKSKLDKIVQVEAPQPVGEVAITGFAPAPTAHTGTPQPHRIHAVANAPPLYISYCTFLI